MHPLPSLKEIAGVMPASRLERPPWSTVSCGIAAVDELTGGLPRGALTEICGPPSSGRSSLMLAALAEATRRSEICALVDATDSFDPLSAAAAGVDLERVLWIRILAPLQGAPNWGTASGGSVPLCGTPPPARIPGAAARLVDSTDYERRTASCAWETPRNEHKSSRTAALRALEQTLKVTDLLLQAAGFGMVVVDLADLPAEVTGRIPLASWFRFRRAIEHTPTVLLVLEPQPFAKSCASLVLTTTATPALRQTVETNHAPPHSRLLCGLDVQVAVTHSRMKKPATRVNYECQVAR